MFIYKITNHVNGKVYIGQSVRPVEERWNRHKTDAISGRLDTHFARAIRKYGVDNFSIEVIDTAKTQAELTLKEHYWIGYYNAVNTGYNETDAMFKCGGNTYFSKTAEEVEVIKEKIRITKLGEKNPNSVKVKCRNSITGEEHHFNSAIDMQKFFKKDNHSFITNRVLGKTKVRYLGIWDIAYEDCEYNKDSLSKMKHGKSKSVFVKDLKTGEEKVFYSMADAEKELNYVSRKLYNIKRKKGNSFTIDNYIINIEA